MSWFPEEYNDRKECNIDDFSRTLRTLASSGGSIGAGKIPADDVTFMIPYGTDSRQRFENMVSVLTWIWVNTTAKIYLFVSETLASQDAAQGGTPWCEKVLLDGTFETDMGRARCAEAIWRNLIAFRLNRDLVMEETSYDINNNESVKKDFLSRLKVFTHLRKNDEPFHRTRYLNMMLDQVTTPIVVNHDADVILQRVALCDTLNYLRVCEDVDCVYPYGFGEYQLQIFDKTGDRLEEVIHSGDISALLRDIGRGYMLWNAAYGHSIFMKTLSYKSMMGENEEFVSWGAEDVERYVRMLKFGFKIARIRGGYVIHLEHPRGNDSSNKNPHFKANEDRWTKLQGLTDEELFTYYKNVKYAKKYNWAEILR